MQMAPTAKLYSNGRITVPKAIRKYLKLRPGSRVEFRSNCHAIPPPRPKRHDRSFGRKRKLPGKILTCLRLCLECCDQGLLETVHRGTVIVRFRRGVTDRLAPRGGHFALARVLCQP